MRNKHGLSRIGGRTAVCAVAFLAGVLLVVAARWIAGEGWPQMLADLAQ